MGYLIAYLLLALAIDLLSELLNPDDRRRPLTVRRRLWSDTDFDCCSRVFAVETAVRAHSMPKPSTPPRKQHKRCRSWLGNPWKAQGVV